MSGRVETAISSQVFLCGVEICDKKKNEQSRLAQPAKYLACIKMYKHSRRTNQENVLVSQQKSKWIESKKALHKSAVVITVGVTRHFMDHYSRIPSHTLVTERLLWSQKYCFSCPTYHLLTDYWLALASARALALNLTPTAVMSKWALISVF